MPYIFDIDQFNRAQTTPFERRLIWSRHNSVTTTLNERFRRLFVCVLRILIVSPKHLKSFLFFRFTDTLMNIQNPSNELAPIWTGQLA